MMMTYGSAAILAYLFGSIPFGFLLVLAFLHEDIRKTGSGNIGATNVLRSGRRGLGALTFLLDTGKGYVAVSVTRYIVARYLWTRHLSGSMEAEHAAAVAAVFAVVGHVFPIWLRGKGGKGVATALGVFLALAPLAALCALGTFICVVAVSRYVSLASIVSSASFPIFVWLWGRAVPVGPALAPWNGWLVVSSLVVPAIILLKHTPNIRRLCSGTEYRFGRKESVPA